MDPKLVPNLIDEMPVLFIAGALAEGTTRIRGAQELRFKESDRLESMARALNLFGVKHKIFEDGIDIEGVGQSGKNPPFNSAEIDSFGDHRIAMAFAVMGSKLGNDLKIEDKIKTGIWFTDFYVKEKYCFL